MGLVTEHLSMAAAEKQKERILRDWRRTGYKGRVTISRARIKATDGTLRTKYRVYVE